MIIQILSKGKINIQQFSMLWLGILLCLLTSLCNQKNNENNSINEVKIYGTASNMPNNGWIDIEKIQSNDVVLIKNIKDIEKNGVFETFITIEESSFFRINFNNQQTIIIIIDGDEKQIEIKLDMEDPYKNYEVLGSKGTRYKLKMDTLIADYQRSMNSLQSEYLMAQSNQNIQKIKILDNKITDYSLKTENKLKGLINEAIPSLAVYHGLQMIDQEKNISFLNDLLSKMSEKKSNHYMTQQLKSYVQSQQIVSIGAIAPEISLPNPDGKIIHLSDFQGSYVLIDFWAAWCRPCRIENPNVVEIYKKYMDKNFEILGVSLDKTKTAWINAIKEDKLLWKHVSDLQYWKSAAATTYHVQSIPATFLVDPNGKIIAKNLRGQSLRTKLEEIFN